MNLKSLTLMSALSCFLASTCAFADIAVIAGSGNSASVSKKDVKKIFLGKKTSMNPMDLPDGSAIRDEFYQKVAKKNPSQMKSYWSKMIFSGKATPPENADDDAAVKAWVAKNPKGIGYIDSGSVDDSVKVLLTIN